MSLTHAAAAEGPRDVRVAESTCGEVPWTSAAWIALLRAELAADDVAVRGPGDPNPTEAPKVFVDPSTCAATATTATLTLATGSLRKTREVHLADTDAIARPRVLAIAMAELVRSTLSAASVDGADRKPRVELDVRIHLEPSPAIAREGSSPSSTRAGASTSVFAATEVRTFPEGSTGLFGGRLGLLVPLVESVALVADAGVLGGTAHDSLGDIGATVVTFGAALLGTARAASVVVGVGPRIEGGVAWLGGEAGAATTSATTETTGLLTIAMSAAASVQLRRSWSGMVAVDAGTTLYGFHGLADDRHVLELVGPMLAMRIGFAWSPSAPH